MRFQQRAGWMAAAVLTAAIAVGLGCTKKKEEEKPPEKTEKGHVDTEGRKKDPAAIDKTTKPAGQDGLTKPQPRLATTTVPTTGPGPKVLIKTSMGDIVVQLNPAKAPISVKNFLRYANEKGYDGTIFHRVIPHFMIQGGGFTPKFVKKPTHPPIKNEATNGLRHVRGTIAMARTMVIDSATNQFFINVKDNMFLNHRGQTGRTYGYAVFGKVIKGMDVVDKIRYVPTGAKGPFAKDCPVKDVMIISARVLPAAGALPAGNKVKPRGKKPKARTAPRKTK